MNDSRFMFENFGVSAFTRVLSSASTQNQCQHRPDVNASGVTDENAFDHSTQPICEIECTL